MITKKLKILVIGSGGREQAICDALVRSPQKPEVYNFGTNVNPGIKKICTKIVVGNILNLDEIRKVAKKISPTFVVIGPDDPIGIGVVDVLLELNITSFAPNKACAKLESSKSFTRNLLKKYNIDVSPDFYVSKSIEDSRRKEFYDKFAGQIVVKADGLLGGKGVLVADDHFSNFKTADDFAKESIKKFGKVVLEEKLTGEEFSLISIVDGETVLDTPAIQDHKRAFDGDEGPNTGGMGTVSDESHSLPFLTKSDVLEAHEITTKTMSALQKELGEKYVGVMYGGFIKTKKGIKLIEYNARFGDPEVYNILPILKTDFVEVCQKAINGSLYEIGKLEFEPVATVMKHLCCEGYPVSGVKDALITVFPFEEDNSQRVFYWSLYEKNGKLYTSGSRAIGVLGMGKNIAEALKNCENMVKNFDGPLFYRKDIGKKFI